MIKMKKILASGLLAVWAACMVSGTVKVYAEGAGLDPPPEDTHICAEPEDQSGEIFRERASMARSAAATGNLQVRWRESLGTVDPGLMSLGDPFNVSLKYVDTSDSENMDMRGKNRMLYCLQYHRNGPIGQVTWDKNGSTAPQIAYLMYWGSRYLGRESVWKGYRTGYGWKYDVAATQYAVHVVNKEYSLNTLYSHLKGPKRDHFYSIIKKMSEDAQKSNYYTPFQGGWKNLNYSLSDKTVPFHAESLGGKKGYATKWISQKLWDGAEDCKEYITSVRTSIDHNGRVVWKDQGLNGDFKIWIPESEYLNMQEKGGKVTVNVTGTHHKCLAGWVYKSNKPDTDQNVTMLEGGGGNQAHSAQVFAEVPQKKINCYIDLLKKDQGTELAQARGGGSLAGAEYIVTDQNGNILDTMTTQEDGKASSTALPLGTYYVKEIKPSRGYGLDETVYTVSFENLDVKLSEYRKPVTSMEPCKMGSVRLKKIAEKDGKPLKGGVFTLYKEDGTKEGQYTTDDMGILEVKGLYFGNYYFMETQAPPGYIEEKGKIPFTIDDSCIDMAKELTVKNKLKRVEITLIKEIRAEDINFANGNPIFIFEVRGRDLEGHEHAYHATVEFTEQYVKEKKDSHGAVRMQAGFTDIPSGYYEALEWNVMRYSLNSIKEPVNGLVEDEKAHFDLVHNDMGSAVFVNEKHEWGDWSDTGLCKNIIKRK